MVIFSRHDVEIVVHFSSVFSFIIACEIFMVEWMNGEVKLAAGVGWASFLFWHNLFLRGRFGAEMEGRNVGVV